MKNKWLRYLCACIALVMTMCFAACGSGETEEQEPAEDAQDRALTEDEQASKVTISGSSYDELAELYQFELDGKTYSLPADPNEFVSAGWYIPDDYLDTELGTNEVEVIWAYTDSSENEKAFLLDVINREDSAKPIRECLVDGIQVDDSYACAGGIKMLKAGIDVDVSNGEAAKKTAELLKAAYGTGEDIFLETKYEEDGSTIDTWEFDKLMDNDVVNIGASDATTIEITEGADDSTYVFHITYDAPLE